MTERKSRETKMAYQQVSLLHLRLDQWSVGVGYRKELTSTVLLDVPSVYTLRGCPYDHDENEGKTPMDTQGITFL